MIAIVRVQGEGNMKTRRRRVDLLLVLVLSRMWDLLLYGEEAHGAVCSVLAHCLHLEIMLHESTSEDLGMSADVGPTERGTEYDTP